ncbi:alpha/beta fold hydrolase [Marinobacter sp. F4216]|uniref:alpha/beta fold hydrolase n=1 Tax=Marinobacter sp. F4216 TaxID=2874281 RepID=UPI001CC08FF9|nr:alpha/beta hydrolase [Marinobacter sp. F4216]MBZ2169447.1 alpha/beta hydrolase [Marinobacter sp. F4216]
MMNTIKTHGWLYLNTPKNCRALASLLIASVLSVATAACTTSTTNTQNATETTPMSTATTATETQFMSINDRQIAYRSIGEGAPLLLINRFRGTLDTWDPAFIGSLAESRKVIIMDYPGIGYSEGTLSLDAKEVAADVKRFAEQLALGKVDLLGWSYGGLIAQYVAFLHPDTVHKVVLVGTNPPGKPEVPMEQAFQQHALKPAYALEDYTVLFFEPKSESSRAAAKASMERYWEKVDHSKVPGTMEMFQRYIGGMRGVMADADDLRKEFATTEVPMLVLMGDHDISFAVENWFPLVREAPKMQLVVFPEAGHAPHFQYPTMSAAYIDGFLR